MQRTQAQPTVLPQARKFSGFGQLAIPRRRLPGVQAACASPTGKVTLTAA